jgi:hypothetical protein
MNKDTRTALATKLAEVLKQKGVQLPYDLIGLDLIDEIEKDIYQMVGKKVPFEDYNQIWKLYNLQGGYTVKELARKYNLSEGTVTAIVKDKYF